MFHRPLLTLVPALVLNTAVPALAQDEDPKSPRVNVLLQSVYQAGTASDSVDGFRVQRANVWLRAQPHPLIAYWVMFDPAKRLRQPVIIVGPSGQATIGPRDESVLQDGFVTLGTTRLFLDIGQMRPALSEDALTQFHLQPLPSRPLFNSESASFGFFRDIGAVVTYKESWGSFQVGTFNGSGPGVLPQFHTKDYNARLILTPFESVKVSAATYQGVQRILHDASVGWKLGPLELQAEGIFGSESGAWKTGAYGQATYRLIPELMGVIRIEGWDPAGVARKQLDSTLGVNWYLAADSLNKLIGAYTFQDFNSGEDNHRVSFLFQAML